MQEHGRGARVGNSACEPNHLTSATREQPSRRRPYCIVIRYRLAWNIRFALIQSLSATPRASPKTRLQTISFDVRRKGMTRPKGRLSETDHGSGLVEKGTPDDQLPEFVLGHRSHLHRAARRRAGARLRAGAEISSV